MGKYVTAAQQRTRRTMPRMMTSPGACPFSGASASDDEATCVLDSLTSDPRVSTELAVNLVMALFRTGVDSVCTQTSSCQTAVAAFDPPQRARIIPKGPKSRSLRPEGLKMRGRRPAESGGRVSGRGGEPLPTN